MFAEKWLPLKEVPEDALCHFLADKKKEGYTLVGIEQCSGSVPLQTYTFPKKTVILLGREKEGIPAEFLSALDVFLEIPQLGVIRSLNVHTSGALAIFEYTKQQLQRQ